MSTITSTTQLRLINNLANLGTASSTDLFLIQKNLKSFKFQYSDLVTGLPDDSTIEASSDKLRIKDLGVTTGKIANNAVNFSKMQDIANNKLIGRTASGSGDPSEVDIITDLGSASNSNIPTGTAVVNAIPTYSNDIQTNGWTQLPNNLVMQWGIVTNSATSVIVTFPVAFNTQVLNLQITDECELSTGGHQVIASYFGSPTLTQFSLSKQLDVQVYWLAIGY